MVCISYANVSFAPLVLIYYKPTGALFSFLLALKSEIIIWSVASCTSGHWDDGVNATNVLEVQITVWNCVGGQRKGRVRKQSVHVEQPSFTGRLQPSLACCSQTPVRIAAIRRVTSDRLRPDASDLAQHERSPARSRQGPLWSSILLHFVF